VLMTTTRCGLVGQDTRRGTFGQRHAVLWTATPAPSTRRSGSSTRPARGSTPTTRCCRSSRRSASSTATRSPARGAGLLGGPVRRLRQRRADDHGRVHQLR
jgi:hypothetical protein